MLNTQRAIDRNVAFGNKGNTKNFDLQIKMLQEELSEYVEACKADDPIERFDAILDLIFVAVGAAHDDGIDADQIRMGWEEVCDSNFTKFPMTKNEEGKIMKGPNFRGPLLSEIIELNGKRYRLID